ncbi:Major facilitator superfamily domain-containing protein 12 [Lamellibrachia satsuma]|nr:Major facilitator superfamily domain-containing protein 12 [Lamellibrachia satsuma]
METRETMPISSGAFVYGALSFTDKLSNGIAVLVIQQLHPCRTVVCCSDCIWFYRNTMTFVPAGFAILAILTLLTLAPQKIGRLHKDKGKLTITDERSPLLPDDTDHHDR